MAQYLTLEEAAERLGISPSDFKKRLRTEWTHIRPMQDGSTQRFKDKDIEELARQIGFGSEEELTLADPSDSGEIVRESHRSDESPAPAKKSPSGKITTSKPAAKVDAPLPIADDALVLGDQEVFLLADDAPKPKTASGKIMGGGASSGAGSGKGSKSDSDVRLEKSGKTKRVADSGTDEEIDLSVLPSGGSSTKAGKSGKLTSGSSSKLKSGKLPAVPSDDSSEFELRLDADSSDEFELSLANDSDEISLGDLPVQAPTGKTGQSGINIGKPSDSGRSLEKKKATESGKSKKSGKIPVVKPDTDSDQEIDFELSLDQAGASSKKIGSGKKLGSGKKVDSDSEFELTLDEGDLAANLEAETTTFSTEEGEKGDIFETDFEIPALDDDSASEVVSVDESDTDLDSSSDFDLAIDEPTDGSVEDESASQVVVLDDETETPVKAKKKPAKPVKGKKKAVVEEEEDLVVEEAADEDAVSFDEMEIDESESASKALEGVSDDEEEEEEEEKQVVVVSGTAPWGVFPALFMLPTIFIVFLAGIMGYELMQSMWGYHQTTKPASMVVNEVAKVLDMAPNEGGSGGAAAK